MSQILEHKQTNSVIIAKVSLIHSVKHCETTSVDNAVQTWLLPARSRTVIAQENLVFVLPG